MNYQIADALTRIKNAYLARHKEVIITKTKLGFSLVKILFASGFVNKPEFDKKTNSIRMGLRFIKRKPALTDMRIISKPSLRVYLSKKELPRVLGGLGTAIISTSGGLMTEKEARKKGLGGELICKVW
ncbi:30S ribosomal protein S8 [Candidatus Microgenomates bacterium]|nr:30S ribosomal protein S8 [Candidatus Microgenomates bacterium]MBI2622180.1 30S ribosomal protein S8 [Candidatus Microgenomates bacterium]